MIYENCGICVLYGCILWLKSCSRFCMQMKFGKHQTGLGVNCNGKCQSIYSVGLQMWDDGKWIQSLANVRSWIQSGYKAICKCATGIATAGRVPGSDCSSDGWKCGGEPTLLMVARHNQPLLCCADIHCGWVTCASSKCEQIKPNMCKEGNSNSSVIQRMQEGDKKCLPWKTAGQYYQHEYTGKRHIYR